MTAPEPSLVVGGGLAGAAVACLLARAGRRVRVLERDAAPVEKICGEFLSGEAVRSLARLDIDLAGLGAARIAGVRLVRGAKVLRAALPFAAFGLSRRVLDTAVLAAAAAHGAEICRGTTVSCIRPGPVPTLSVAGMGDLRADAVFLATGKHELRGVRRPIGRTPADLVGFKLHLRLTPPQQAALAGHVEIVLLADGYAGLQPVDDGWANLCLLVSRGRLQRTGGWTGLLDELCRGEPHLRDRLADAVPRAPRPLSIARVPYGFIHPRHADHPAVFRLGDQMAVIPSFTGGGMAIALHSAFRAAEAHLAGESAVAYAGRMRRDTGGQIARAAMLQRIGRSTSGQALLMHAGAAWPGLLGIAARLTRLPARSARAFAVAVLACLLMHPAVAQTTPAGYWRTFDDRTGRERGRVLIEEHDGVFEGKVVGTVDPVEATRRCERCTGARRDAPVLGLTIMNGMRADGDHWDGGEILDPQTGDVYRCTMRLADAGETLVVRGYLGISLLGRSQTWLRAP